MTTIHSFNPLAHDSARTLILGSIPGKKSLSEGQYYAHQRNAFWKIMAALLAFEPSLAYERRISLLCDRHIAVWDVLAMCTRESSLDSDIVESSIVPNDFNQLFERLPNLTHIYFNGAKAEQSYNRYVFPQLKPDFKLIPTTRLPSTSPAHASVNFEGKLQAWKAILESVR